MLVPATANTSNVSIADLVEILPGLSTGGPLAHTADGSHQVLLSRHLVPGLPYRYSAAHEFRINPGRDARRYEVRPGDVLIMSRGTRNVASWIESVPDRSVAPVSFYILRPGSAVHPGYLAWFLNQPGAQRAIGDIRTGAGTPIVQRGPFSEMPIPVPDLSVQRVIASLGEAMVRERLILERLTDATTRLHEMTSEQIARNVLAHPETTDGE
jgi:hypothetical protein